MSSPPTTKRLLSGQKLTLSTFQSWLKDFSCSRLFPSQNLACKHRYLSQPVPQGAMSIAVC